jgi:hypothetical protein
MPIHIEEVQPNKGTTRILDCLFHEAKACLCDGVIDSKKFVNSDFPTISTYEIVYCARFPKDGKGVSVKDRIKSLMQTSFAKYAKIIRFKELTKVLDLEHLSLDTYNFKIELY